MAHLSLRVWGKSGGQDTVTFTPRYFKVQEIFPQGITGVTNRKKAACHQNKCNNCPTSQDRFSCILFFFFLQPVLLHLSLPLILFILSYLHLFPGVLSSCSAQAVEESRELCNCCTQRYLWKTVASDGPFIFWGPCPRAIDAPLEKGHSDPVK